MPRNHHMKQTPTLCVRTHAHVSSFVSHVNQVSHIYVRTLRRSLVILHWSIQKDSGLTCAHYIQPYPHSFSSSVVFEDLLSERNSLVGVNSIVQGPSETLSLTYSNFLCAFTPKQSNLYFDKGLPGFGNWLLSV